MDSTSRDNEHPPESTAASPSFPDNSHTDDKADASSRVGVLNNPSPTAPTSSSSLPSRPSSMLLSDPMQLQDRCEALESELSTLRSRLHQYEQSSTLREKRLSQAQQLSSTTQQSMQTLKQQHEMMRIQLTNIQEDAALSRSQLEDKTKENRQLKSTIQEQRRELDEVVLDRDSLSLEMVECHADNAKFLKRLRTSNDKVDRLQDENRYLIEQLRELRAKVVEVADEKTKVSETLDRERQRAGQAALELERVVARYKDEVERLQDLVLAMGQKHVQVQGQLTFLQHQAQAQLQIRQQQLPAIEQGGSTDPQQQQQQRQDQPQEQSLRSRSSSAHSSSMSNVAPSLQSLDSASSSLASTLSSSQQQQQHQLGAGIVLGDGALASILSSIAASSHLRRSKPARRFTVNNSSASFTSSHERQEQEATPLTLEQRKCKFLMDQITVLQRGYDNLRQEKITMELQLDLMQRQHEFHQQQQQQRQQREKRKIAMGGQDEENLEVGQRPGEGGIAQGQAHVQEIDETIESERINKELRIKETLASLESKHGQSITTLVHEPQQTASTSEAKDEGSILRSDSSLFLSNPGRKVDEGESEEEHDVRDEGDAGRQQQQQRDKQGQRHRRQYQDDYRLRHVHRPPRIAEVVEWDVQQCSCCMGVLIEI
ncbi:hypothetical protein BGZ98_007174 [Dissophora globulifera]|nr:hypothetical protein BGZ98_007174 [Dissophora globulifera]